jgi:hypothetical protein
MKINIFIYYTDTQYKEQMKINKNIHLPRYNIYCEDITDYNYSLSFDIDLENLNLVTEILPNITEELKKIIARFTKEDNSICIKMEVASF